MIISVHQPQYLPWLGYFDKIYESDCFVFLDTVQYKVREFQNRNKIRTKDGWIWLTVPVQTKGSPYQKISDVLIDNSLNWAAKHRKSIEVWYGGADFFKDYFPFFQDLYEKKWEKLIDLNMYIIKYLVKCLKIDTPVYLESEIGTAKKSTERIIEICSKLKADTYLSGSGGRDYIEENLFEQAGIKLKFQDFKHPEYTQQFQREGYGFEAYMSVIDLLFNCGPQAFSILRGKG